MDLDSVREGLALAIPFNRHLGLEVTELTPGRGVVVLPDSQALRNHVGTQHAAGLFAAGEAASGAAFASIFADRLADITALASEASISYRKLARGPIAATARLDADVAALRARLDAERSVRFTVAVELTNPPGDVVAEMRVGWHVSLRDA